MLEYSFHFMFMCEDMVLFRQFYKEQLFVGSQADSTAWIWLPVLATRLACLFRQRGWESDTLANPCFAHKELMVLSDSYGDKDDW